MKIPQSLERLINALALLPGIGRKTAQRLAFHVLRMKEQDANTLAQSVLEARKRLHACPVCFAITEDDPCPVCRDETRDGNVLVVVENASDIMIIENTGRFHGRYHVLQGSLSPMDGIGPDQLRMGELKQRVIDQGIKELIIATNPDVEGEATASFIARLMAETGVHVTRIATGLPTGSELEFSNPATIVHAIKGRQEIRQGE